METEVTDEYAYHVLYVDGREMVHGEKDFCEGVEAALLHPELEHSEACRCTAIEVQRQLLFTGILS